MATRTSFIFRGDIFIGLIIVILGVIFLLQNLYPEIHVWRFLGKLWPVILIILGIYILFDWSGAGSGHRLSGMAYTKILGDSRLDYAGKEIGDTDIPQMIGDLTIDLRGGRLKSGENHFTISNIIGDTIIYIPGDFPLKFTGKALVGDLRFDNRTEEGLIPRFEHIDDTYLNAGSKLWVTFSGMIGDMTLKRV